MIDTFTLMPNWSEFLETADADLLEQIAFDAEVELRERQLARDAAMEQAMSHGWEPWDGTTPVEFLATVGA